VKITPDKVKIKGMSSFLSPAFLKRPSEADFKNARIEFHSFRASPIDFLFKYNYLKINQKACLMTF